MYIRQWNNQKENHNRDKKIPCKKKKKGNTI